MWSRSLKQSPAHNEVAAISRGQCPSLGSTTAPENEEKCFGRGVIGHGEAQPWHQVEVIAEMWLCAAAEHRNCAEEVLK